MDSERRPKHAKKMPLVLILSEIILAVVLLRYIMNFTHLVSPVEVGWFRQVLNCISIILSMTMCILCVNSIIGLSSSKLRSWRTVVRSSISLFITNLLYTITDSLGLISSGFVISNEFAAVLVLLSIVIMFLPSVRDFYTPPVYECPPVKNWIWFLLSAPRMKGVRYEAAYAGENKGEDMIDVTENLIRWAQRMESADKK